RQFLRIVGRHVLVAGAGGYVLWSEVACRSRSTLTSGSTTGAEGAGADASLSSSATGSATAPGAFTAAELVTIAAVCDRLLPRDQDPGAIDLGVPAYIDRMLVAPDLASYRDLLHQVIPILDRQSRIRSGGKAFHEASDEQKDSLLAAWQRGRGGD